MKKVMVAIERSAEAVGFTTVAVALAGAEAEVDVVHMADLASGQSLTEACEAIAAAVDLIRARGLPCHGHVESTDAGVARRTVEKAHQLGADLVVMGSRGLCGVAAVREHSVSHAVLAELELPVVVLPGHARLPIRGFRRVLVAVGAEADAGPVAAAVGLLPGAMEVLVTHVPRRVALHVGRRPGGTFAEIGETSTAVLAEAVGRFQEAGIPVTVRTLERTDGVATTLADAARDWDADVIVLGSRRPGDWEALVAGSTAHGVLHQGDRPVLFAEHPHTS
ncbi:MAG TPA: universal stress protein [Candidatus Dormibacteraeota bacterium]|jgi:nucleotide-binding universal stress UspA family protein